jgi:hypothetical protein
MATTTQASAANFSPKPCSNCGNKELQRKPRSFGQKILGVYPYICLRCAHHETSFRFNLGIMFRLALLFALVGAGVLLWLHPISFHHSEDPSSQGTAEALAQARTSAGGLSAFEQMMVKKPKATLDNATVLKLWRANVGANVILQMIRTSTADYDVSASAIIDLKQAGVDQSIILAMIDASYSSR